MSFHTSARNLVLSWAGDVFLARVGAGLREWLSGKFSSPKGPEMGTQPFWCWLDTVVEDMAPLFLGHRHLAVLLGLLLVIEVSLGH